MGFGNCFRSNTWIHDGIGQAQWYVSLCVCDAFKIGHHPFGQRARTIAQGFVEKN